VRINEALSRERRFSADVSHQLRTPLTGIRLRLEAARSQRDPDMIGPALDDLHRLEQTVDHLLAFARDAVPATSTVRLDDAARDAANRWSDRVATAGRTIKVSTTQPVTTRGSVTSTQQILDVLIDNAVHHGTGDIAIAQRRIAGGAAIDVTDEGKGIDPADSGRIFHRGEGDRNGIGLALARSIAEAEGGRLLLSRTDPTTFSLILLDPDQNGEP
jgi:signal transduction histidine kinase